MTSTSSGAGGERHDDSFYKSLMDRTVRLSLPIEGRPYARGDFVPRIQQTVGLGALYGLGPTAMGNVWEITLKTQDQKTQLLSAGDFKVKGYNCVVSDLQKKRYKVRAHWAPLCVPMEQFESIFRSKGCKVLSSSYDLTAVNGCENVRSMIRTFLLETDQPTNIPYLANWSYRNTSGQTLLTMTGRAPVCLRCEQPGHVRRNCTTQFCRRCRKYGHDTEGCAGQDWAARSRNPLPEGDLVEEDAEKDSDTNIAHEVQHGGNGGRTEVADWTAAAPVSPTIQISSDSTEVTSLPQLTLADYPLLRKPAAWVDCAEVAVTRPVPNTTETETCASEQTVTIGSASKKSTMEEESMIDASASKETLLEASSSEMSRGASEKSITEEGALKNSMTEAIESEKSIDIMSTSTPGDNLFTSEEVSLKRNIETLSQSEDSDGPQTEVAQKKRIISTRQSPPCPSENQFERKQTKPCVVTESRKKASDVKALTTLDDFRNTS